MLELQLLKDAVSGNCCVRTARIVVCCVVLTTSQCRVLVLVLVHTQVPVRPPVSRNVNWSVPEYQQLRRRNYLQLTRCYGSSGSGGGSLLF